MCCQVRSRGNFLDSAGMWTANFINIVRINYLVDPSADKKSRSESRFRSDREKFGEKRTTRYLLARFGILRIIAAISFHRVAFFFALDAQSDKNFGDFNSRQGAIDASVYATLECNTKNLKEQTILEIIRICIFRFSMILLKFFGYIVRTR